MIAPALLSGSAAWVLPGASLDMNFTNSRFWANGAQALGSVLSTTRASTGYAQWADGHWSSFGSGVPRITDLGLLVEQAATNVVLWSRDLTNAAWTKSNTTAALTQVGADGVANSATLLTATAGNGTCLQAITLASSARFQSAWVKRITGSGTINMTTDGGTTWTAITVTNSYTQLTIPTQTLANPSVGFRIVTNGDAIAVDFVQNETGTFATSPIPTTSSTATRAADVISLTGAAATAALNAKALFVKTNLMANGSTPRFMDWGGLGTAQTAAASSTTTVAATSSGVGATATLGSGTTAGVVKSAFGFDATSITAIANGGTKVTNVMAWGAPSGTVYIGNRAAGDRAINGYWQRLALGNVKDQFSGLTQ